MGTSTLLANAVVGEISIPPTDKGQVSEMVRELQDEQGELRDAVVETWEASDVAPDAIMEVTSSRASPNKHGDSKETSGKINNALVTKTMSKLQQGEPCYYYSKGPRKLYGGCLHIAGEYTMCACLAIDPDLLQPFEDLHEFRFSQVQNLSAE